MPQEPNDFIEPAVFIWPARRLTSNLDFDEWGEAFPNKILGAATLDRLRHGAYRVVLDGKSYREPKPLSTSKKSTLKTRQKNVNN